MKKFHIFLVFFIMIFSTAMTVQASPAPKIVESELYSSADEVKVGETITLTAKTLKKGSGYTEEWNGALVTKSYLDHLTDHYVSEAEFTPEQTGTYTITYTIKMHTGNDEVKFISSATKTIEVISDVQEVKGLEVKNINAYPNTGINEAINGYTVIGELYVLWTDNTSTPYGTVSYFFSPSEESRVVDITVSIDNKEYTFPVTISINQ